MYCKKHQDIGHAQTTSLVRDLILNGQFVGTKNLSVPYQKKVKLINWINPVN